MMATAASVSAHRHRQRGKENGAKLKRREFVVRIRGRAWGGVLASGVIQVSDFKRNLWFPLLVT